VQAVRSRGEAPLGVGATDVGHARREGVLADLLGKRVGARRRLRVAEAAAGHVLLGVGLAIAVDVKLARHLLDLVVGQRRHALGDVRRPGLLLVRLGEDD
jgi:hypothetical protein